MGMGEKNGSPVITGIGMICSLGSNRREVWDRMLAGAPRMGAITHFNPKDYGVEDCVVAEIQAHDFEMRLTLLRERSIEVPRKGRFRSLALIAAADAIEDAGLCLAHRKESVLAGVVLGTITAGAEEVEHIVQDAYRGKKPKLSDNLGKRTSVAIQDLARVFNMSGPMFGVDAACASGAFAFTQACRLVAAGDVPWCVAGGVEASIVPSSIKLAHSLGILTTSFSAEPNRASRPFDRLREGTVYAEGACFLIVENEAHALERGARLYARVGGFAEHVDGSHPTKLSDKFAETVMLNALHKACIPANKLGWISAHATSTRQGDAAEAKAIFNLANGHRILCSAPKSVTGHLLGASGAFGAAFSALSLYEQRIPPTTNLENLDPKCPVNCVQMETSASFDYVLSNAFGFGGGGSSIVLKRA